MLTIPHGIYSISADIDVNILEGPIWASFARKLAFTAHVYVLYI